MPVRFGFWVCLKAAGTRSSRSLQTSAQREAGIDNELTDGLFSVVILFRLNSIDSKEAPHEINNMFSDTNRRSLPVGFDLRCNAQEKMFYYE